MKRIIVALGMLAVLMSATAYADGGGVGLGVGILKIKDADDSSLWFTGNFRLNLSPSFVLEPEVGWAREKVEGYYGDYNVDLINFGGSALFIVPAEKIEFFIGGGLGAHMMRVSGDDIDSESETKLGFHGLAGLDLKASEAISLFGAVRYEIINTDGDEKQKQWKIYGGLRFRSH